MGTNTTLHLSQRPGSGNSNNITNLSPDNRTQATHKMLLFSVVHTGNWRNVTARLVMASPTATLLWFSGRGESKQVVTQPIRWQMNKKRQPASFRRSTAKVKRVEVFRKEACQLCCSVRDQESTPPLSKMSRPLLAQPRSKFLRLTCKLKGMCIAREMTFWVLSGLRALQKMLFSCSSSFWFSEEFCVRSIFLCLSHTPTANTKWVKHVNSFPYQIRKSRDHNCQKLICIPTNILEIIVSFLFW